MKKNLFIGLCAIVMGLYSLGASADSSVTLSSAKKNMKSESGFKVSLKNGAVMKSNMIRMPKGKKAQFTVTYGNSDKLITKIEFGWATAPSSGTISANYGTYSSAWTAPEGGLKSVRFSSNGKSEALLKQMVIYYKSKSVDPTPDPTPTPTPDPVTPKPTGMSSYDMNAPLGWATVNGNTTGSADKNAVTVSTKADLLSALSGTDAKTIYVKGTISFTGMETVKDAANKTVYGLPGSVLENAIHSAVVSQSGVLSFSRCKNMILRNLTFKSAGAYDIDGNDNLQLQACDYIWVDHCEFLDGVDGNFDCNNGSDHISITWCRFRYLIKPFAGGSGGSDDHRNCCLWGGSDNNTKDVGRLRTTFANCWWDEGCHERMPRVRNGQVHIVNCLFSCTGNNYCIGAGYASNIYAEKNVFSGVINPWKCYAEKSGKTDYNITMTGNSGAPDEQKSSGSRAFFNPYSVYSYTTMAVDKVQGEVSGHAGATLQITVSSASKAQTLISGSDDNSTTGIESAGISSEVKSVKYYKMYGAEIPQLQKGLNIIKTVKADGKIEIKKVSIR